MIGRLSAGSGNSVPGALVVTYDDDANSPFPSPGSTTLYFLLINNSTRHIPLTLTALTLKK